MAVPSRSPKPRAEGFRFHVLPLSKESKAQSMWAMEVWEGAFLLFDGALMVRALKPYAPIWTNSSMSHHFDLRCDAR